MRGMADHPRVNCSEKCAAQFACFRHPCPCGVLRAQCGGKGIGIGRTQLSPVCLVLYPPCTCGEWEVQWVASGGKLQREGMAAQVAAGEGHVEGRGLWGGRVQVVGEGASGRQDVESRVWGVSG